MGETKDKDREMRKALAKEHELDWDKKCMMMVMAPLFAHTVTQYDRIDEEEALTHAFELYDELERQVTQRLTTGEPDDESQSGTSKKIG